MRSQNRSFSSLVTMVSAIHKRQGKSLDLYDETAGLGGERGTRGGIISFPRYPWITKIGQNPLRAKVPESTIFDFLRKSSRSKLLSIYLQKTQKSFYCLILMTKFRSRTSWCGFQTIEFILLFNLLFTTPLLVHCPKPSLHHTTPTSLS